MDFLPTLDSGKSSYQVNISALCVPHLDFFSRKNLTVLTAYVATLHYVPNSCRDVDPAKKKKKKQPRNEDQSILCSLVQQCDYI